MVDRRTFLSVSGVCLAALSGCTGSSDEDGGDSTGPTDGNQDEESADDSADSSEEGTDSENENGKEDGTEDGDRQDDTGSNEDSSGADIEEMSPPPGEFGARLINNRELYNSRELEEASELIGGPINWLLAWDRDEEVIDVQVVGSKILNLNEGDEDRASEIFEQWDNYRSYPKEDPWLNNEFAVVEYLVEESEEGPYGGGEANGYVALQPEDGEWIIPIANTNAKIVDQLEN